MKTIMPNEVNRIFDENEIQARFEAGELITYEEYEELDDQSRHTVEQRLEQSGYELVEEPGDGYRASNEKHLVRKELEKYPCPECGKVTVIDTCDGPMGTCACADQPWTLQQARGY